MQTSNLFRYIENNISVELDTGLLSNFGYVSRGKLYYDFYSLSGHSVKEYVRKRRLSNALMLIKTSDMELTEIAFECGYSSHQALCRTVKQTLGITPSEYRNSDTYYFFPPWKGELLQSVSVAVDTIPCSMRVLFYHSRLTDIENTAVNTFLQAFPKYKGRIYGRNGEQKGSKLCYELYLTDTEIEHKKLIESGFEIAPVIPCRLSSVFATSTIPNDEHKINSAWNYLYSEWLHKSMFEYTGEPYYEEYILKNSRPVKLKLYLPIKKRDEDTKISVVNNPDLHFITAKAKGYNAEETASKMMVDYLTTYFPHLIKTSKKLYTQKNTNSYVCGVMVSPDLIFEENENIKSVTTTPNNYLVLESNVMGEYDRWADMLLTFAQDNGMVADKNRIFAVYDVKESFRNPVIKMYCLIKICTK